MADQNFDPTQELIAWDFHEYNPKPRSNRWYLWFGIILAFFILLGVFTDNYLFSLIFVLFALIIFLQNWRKPAQLRFVISGQGIGVGSRFYPMKDLESFWIVYKPGKIESIYFDFKSSWRPLVAIPLEGNNPLQVREILLKFLPENLERDDEPLSDSLARMLNL